MLHRPIPERGENLIFWPQTVTLLFEIGKCRKRSHAVIQSLMSFTDELSELVAETLSRLPGISKKRMFACDAFFRSGQVFALIWKTGRIGVRLPDISVHNALMATDGAEPWLVKPNTKPMQHWVLTPESFHDDTVDLASWLGQAYTLAAPTQPIIITKKTTLKKTTTKETAMKKPTVKKSVAKKSVAKKAAAKKTPAKKPAAKKAAAKKTAAKKPAAKKAAAKKPAAKKTAAKKTAKK